MKTAKHIQDIKPSYIREILNAATADGVISLAGGLPAQENFPLPLMEKAIKDLPNRKTLFQYGETKGYQPLLDYFRTHYQLPPTHDSLICTGSQQGLDLIARSFLNPGDGVVMEAPSYLGALQVFSIAQASIKPVQQLNDGPDLDELEAFFASGKTKLFYAVPDFHNPTGVCWSLEVRKKVAELCKQYHVALVEDAPYRALRFSGESLPLVSSFCPENSLVLHSFSKIATPGIRLGLVNGPKEWLSPMIKVKQASDLHSSVPMQAVLLELLTHPLFQTHIEQLCQRYHSQYQTLASALSENLNNRFHFSSIEGGMFIWLILPDLDPMIVAKDAISKGVAVVPSTVFYPGNSEVQPALRLNFSHEHNDNLWEAVKRLASVLL